MDTFSKKIAFDFTTQQQRVNLIAAGFTFFTQHIGNLILKKLSFDDTFLCLLSCYVEIKNWRKYVYV
jgi:hypothetical protein